MSQSRNCVLDRETISRKIRRMALQVAEENAGEERLVVAGINGNGEVVAAALVAALEGVASIQTDVITVKLNKKEPGDAQILPDVDVSGKVVIIVDDVANTGRTMLYALKPFLERQPARIQTMVLVERSHKRFPIQTDYAGLSIATTLQEHIAVETEGAAITGAWLY